MALCDIISVLDPLKEILKSYEYNKNRNSWYEAIIAENLQQSKTKTLIVKNLAASLKSIDLEFIKARFFRNRMFSSFKRRDIFIYQTFKKSLSLITDLCEEIMNLQQRLLNIQQKCLKLIEFLNILKIQALHDSSEFLFSKDTTATDVFQNKSIKNQKITKISEGVKCEIIHLSGLDECQFQDIFSNLVEKSKMFILGKISYEEMEIFTESESESKVANFLKRTTRNMNIWRNILTRIQDLVSILNLPQHIFMEYMLEYKKVSSINEFDKLIELKQNICDNLNYIKNKYYEYLGLCANLSQWIEGKAESEIVGYMRKLRLVEGEVLYFFVDARLCQNLIEVSYSNGSW